MLGEFVVALGRANKIWTHPYGSKSYWWNEIYKSILRRIKEWSRSEILMVTKLIFG